MNWNELNGLMRQAQVAQQGDPRFHDVGNRPERLDRLGPDRAVIARIGLIEHREAVGMASQSKVPASTITPPIEVPWPPIYLVVE